MICHYRHFKDIGYTFEPYVCNRYYDISMMANELENIEILNVKGVDYRYPLLNMTRNYANYMVNNSKLDDKGLTWIGVGPNKTPVEMIKEGSFGGTCFRDICSGLNNKLYKKSSKEFHDLK